GIARGQRALGGGHVGPALEQLARQAGGDLGRVAGQARVLGERELGGARSRELGQRARDLAARALGGRELGLRAGRLGARAGEVELRARALVHARLRDGQLLGAQLARAPQGGQVDVGGTQAEVQVRDLALQREAQRREARLLGLRAALGGFDAAVLAPEDVRLPGGDERDLERALVRDRQLERGVLGVAAARDAGHEIERRLQPAAGSARDRAGLEDARGGRGEVLVVLRGAQLERVELGLCEDRPPALARQRGRVRRGLVRLRVGSRNRERRALVG